MAGDAVPDVKRRSLWPKEHGAYAEAAFPLVTGVIMARAHPAALLFAVATLAAFVAHEPLLVMLGHRGARARQDHGERARRRAAALGAVAAVAGLVAVGIAPQEASLWLVVPISLTLLLLPRVIGGSDKTLSGEIIVSLAFASMALPVGLAGGVTPLPVVATAAVVWAATFLEGTFAVRGVIHAHRLRASDDAAPPSIAPRSLRGRLERNLERTLAVVVSGWVLVAVGLAVVLDFGSPWAVLAAVPGAAAGLALGVARVSTRRLRAVGWTLVLTQLSTLAILTFAAFLAS